VRITRAEVAVGALINLGKLDKHVSIRSLGILPHGGDVRCDCFQISRRVQKHTAFVDLIERGFAEVRGSDQRRCAISEVDFRVKGAQAPNFAPWYVEK
jgi:hypothetical protein